MTGLVIVTAGRKDAYNDYVTSVKEGYEHSDLSDRLPPELNDKLEATDDGRIRLWGTSVKRMWQKVEVGDISLVYRDGKMIAQATVIETLNDVEIAEDLWNTEENPWDPEKPWRYLIFFSDFEEVEVDVEAFNNLVGYDNTYRPQGFTRVADRRIAKLEDEHESVETAINELTGGGVRVHEIGDDEEADEQESLDQTSLRQKVVDASTDGERDAEFEELVAKAFSRLGFEARWIEGGGDTDVEITAPIHAVVEVKARGQGILRSPDAARIRGHRDARNADKALVVAPGFAPAAIDDADRDGIILLPAKQLRELLERREKYGVPPEVVVEYLFEPGAFQTDRLDQLDETVEQRVYSTVDLLAVLRALERADEDEGTASGIRLILKGMQPADHVPNEQVIAQSLALLSHPCLGAVDETEGKYQLMTTPRNAIELLRRFSNLVQEAHALEAE